MTVAWSIRETVTFLDPGFHETKQFDCTGTGYRVK